MPSTRLLKLFSLTLLTGAGLASLERGRARRDMSAPDPTDKLESAPAKSAHGVWQVGKRIALRISSDRVLAEAAGVTFYTLLAIFPAIAALISLFGLVADPSEISKDLSAVSGVVPEGGMQIITEQVHSLTSAEHKALGAGAIIGLLASIWSANAAMKSLFDALNAVFEEKETRGFFRLTALSLAFTLGALLFVILAMIGVIALPAMLSFIGLGYTTEILLKLARWPVLLSAIAVFLALVYRYGPNRTAGRWRWISWGSGFAAVTWVVASAGFSFYVEHFGSYNRTYGSLGAAVGFMTWIWISTIIVLVGGELNAQLEDETR